MSFRPVFDAQQHRRVLADVVRVLLALELHVHHGLAVLELDLADLADLDAGRAHGLALARLNRLGVGQLELHHEGLLLDEREAQTLVGEDEAADADREQHQRGDGHEVPEVVLDRLLHFAAPLASLAAAASL
ncbi:MAG: hypothetical protein WKF40_05025 [Thermoleophilaceae bacterium]